MAVTVREVIDTARVRHMSFTKNQLGDGAVLLFLNQHQRRLMLKFRDALRGMLGVTVQAATQIDGSIVGVDADGAPFYLSSVGDGFALHADDDGAPYFDDDDPPISLDPFGENGGTPGFPLPADVIAFISLAVTYLDGTEGELVMIDETERFESRRAGKPAVFLSGNRLVPFRAQPQPTTDIWTTVSSVQLSYIAVPTLSAMSDLIKLPTVLADVLTDAVAAFFARQSATCTATERRDFSTNADQSEARALADAFDIVGKMQTTRVIYRGR